MGVLRVVNKVDNSKNLAGTLEDYHQRGSRRQRMRGGQTRGGGSEWRSWREQSRGRVRSW